MDRFYKEHFWNQDVYKCLSCKFVTYQLFKYCPKCGKKQNIEDNHENQAKNKGISDFDEVQKILKEIKNHRIRLWDYCITMSVLQFRVYIPDNITNTLISTAITRKINVRSSAWNANLTLDFSEDEYGKVYKLSDKDADIYIESRTICIHQNMPARFVGDISN